MPTKITDTNIAATGVVAGSYTSANITVNESGQIISASSVSVSPRITSIQIADSSYLAIDDTAVSTSGGYIIITGSGFTSGCQVIIGTLVATSISFINSTTIHAQVPAQSSGTYTVYLTNTDGSVAIRVNGLNYSATPSWQTTSPLTSGVINTPISLQLQATSNTSVVYQLQTGSTLPSGLTLSSSGLLTGTVTGLTTNTTYNFTVVAIDQENQDTPQAFSITIQVNDPYFEYTTLLLPGNGTNGAQNNTFLDASTNNFTITRNGNTTQGTFSPFSQTGWGNYFDGSGDYLTLASNAALAFGTGDFTFEFWLNISAHTTTDGRPLGNNTSWAANAWSLHSDHTSYNEKISFWVNNYSSSAVMLVSTTTIAVGTWYHVAVTRSGNSWRLFINGTQEGSTVPSSVGIDGGASDDLFVGGSGAVNEYINGYISNLRITKGGALYTSNFTPSTTPLTTTVSSGTVSLLTCQSNRFKDNSTNNFAITVNGNTSVQAFSPFNPTASWSAATNGGSGYFDGNGDYIVTPTNAALSSTLLASDFTIEMWIYLLQAPSGGPIWTNSTANSDGFTSSYIYSNLSIGTGKVGVNEFTSAAGVLKLNEWTHFACVRNGATVYIYVNGVQVASGAAATYLNTSAAKPLTFGQNYQTSPTATNAYLSGIRVVSTAVYTSNFAPPTAPVTNITNTSLLLNFTNAGIYDATSKNDLETVGGAQISTTQSKWGGSSMAFDGSGDYLRPQNNPQNSMGTGDFTIEAWIYPTSVTSAGVSILSNRSDAGADTVLICAFSTTDGLYFHTQATAVLNSGTPPTANIWQHVAFVRSSGVLKIYRNGTQIGSSVSFTSNLSSTLPLLIGRDGTRSGPATDFAGYIQDLRITRGYARYTSNFTAPTAAFQTL
jgi:hypothetical protein